MSLSFSRKYQMNGCNLFYECFMSTQICLLLPYLISIVFIVIHFLYNKISAENVIRNALKAI